MSVEGHALAIILKAPGCWVRAGMGGTVTGMDMTQVLARVPPDIDPAVIRAMAEVAESPVVLAVLARAASEDAAAPTVP